LRRNLWKEGPIDTFNGLNKAIFGWDLLVEARRDLCPGLLSSTVGTVRSVMIFKLGYSEIRGAHLNGSHSG
jgi:hypothetical protein